MATWNPPHQQAAPETAGLASGLAALDSAESSAVERSHLKHIVSMIATAHVRLARTCAQRVLDSVLTAGAETAHKKWGCTVSM